jgi:acetate---CoA ligase (ADP-forming)
VTEAEAHTMLHALRIAPVLSGARGRPALDIAAAAAAMAALSRVAAAHPELAELEINPLLVTPAEAIALDARFIRADPGRPHPPPALPPGPHPPRA